MAVAQARAVAEALASRFRDDVTVVSGGDELAHANYEGDGGSEGGEPGVGTAEAGGGTDTDAGAASDLGPTEREERLIAEIERIESGGKQKYKQQLPEQGKKFVRDRIDLWFNPEGDPADGDTESESGDGFLFEDGKFAEFDADDVLPADGLITGGAEFEGRNVHFMANDYTVKRGSMAAKGVEKFLRMQQRALKTGKHSGSADLIADDEEHARELVAQLVSYLPDNSDEKPPTSDPIDPAKPPKGIDSIIPQEPNRGYDMTDLIDRIVDADSWFELRPEYGKEILTGFARIDGRPVGIVANQPAHRAGAIFPDAAEKAAGFVWTCDAYNVPLLYLADTPGFMAGSGVEKEGILEQGKKMIYATSAATVPKQCVVVRKAYGAGIYAMSGPAYDPESTIALPSGEIAIMGPEAAINAVYARKLDEIDDEAERKRTEQELREEFREDIDARRMASEVVIDDVVPPSTLREELTNRFSFYEGIEKDRPDKKHGTVL